MENLDLACFQLISHVGLAKSCYVEAIQEAKKGNYDKAKEKIKEGDESFVQGHTSHASLIQQEASGNPVQTTLLLVHSEDQLMSAETIKLMAEELIDCYKKMNSLK